MTRYPRGVEFANRASDSRYPLIPLATAVDTRQLFEIPNTFLVGAYFAIPADLLIEPGYVYISKIINTLSLVSLEISARISGSDAQIGQVDISRTAVEGQIARNGYGVALFKGSTGYEDLRGRVAIASFEDIANQPNGEFLFNFDSAGFEVDCVRPHLRHVAALEVEQGGSILRLGGTVRLAAGANTRLRVEVVDGEPVLYIDALDASQLNESLECEEGASPPIRRINGISGDSQRNVTILGSRCLEVQALTSELQLRNRCSEPCASCDEAEQVRNLIAPFATQIPTLVGLANRLDQAITQTQLNVLASRGGQGNCAQGE